jgi:hypothetical protein
MSDLPFDKDAANSIATRLTAAKAGLGHSYEGRWIWWRKRRKANKISRLFQNTTPVPVAHYMTATRSVSDVYVQVRRTRRRNLSWLWLRIVVSSIWAAIKRARVALLALLIIGTLATVTYIYGPLALKYLSELSAQEPVADQTTPTPQITTPFQTPSTNPQSQGAR